MGYAIGRALRRLQGRAPGDLTDGVARLLEVVKLSPAMAARKPRHLSGGEKQRAAIARALAGDPDVIVADEPVSALDVSVQAAIVNLLTEIQAAHGTTLVFISHDLAVVRYLADTVAVMYLGTIAELGPVERVFTPPYHPYTEALLSAVPVPDPGSRRRAHPARRPGAERRRDSAGLPVRDPLSPAHRRHLRRDAAAGAAIRRSPHRLPHSG